MSKNKNYAFFTMKNLIQIILNIKPNLNDVRLFPVIPISIYGITSIYNYLNQFTDYKWLILPMLKNAELVGLGLIIAILILFHKRLGVNCQQVVAVFVVGVIAINLTIDNSIMRDLWDNRGFPSLSIMISINYLPPIDPFQQIALFGIFLFRILCEKEIVVLINPISKKLAIFSNVEITSNDASIYLKSTQHSQRIRDSSSMSSK